MTESTPAQSRRFRIEVPATSANLGPGFDTLGLALDIVDTVWVETAPGGDDVLLCAVKGNDVSLDPLHNLLCRAYRRWSEESGQVLPGARFTLESRIPIGKGLGSSAAAIVAGLAAAARAAEVKEPRDCILRLATQMEGHADNAAAATLGGLTTAFCEGDTVHALHVANHLSLGVALFIPDDGLPTVEARRALPESVPHRDAVFDLGRLSYLTTALIWGYWDRIGPVMQDCLHQPYRSHLIPALDTVIASAREAGAYGAALSGGGPGVIALGPAHEAERFAAAMEQRAHESGWAGTGIVTQVRHLGVQVTEEE